MHQELSTCEQYVHLQLENTSDAISSSPMKMYTIQRCHIAMMKPVTQNEVIGFLINVL